MGETRFAGTGETRGYPYLVCKKIFSSTAKNRINSVSSVRKNYHSIKYRSMSLIHTLIFQSTLLHPGIEFRHTFPTFLYNTSPDTTKLLISQSKFSGTRKFTTRYQ